MTLSASIVIVTKNRKEELRVAIASALKQSVQPEIIVMDDGSMDGTAGMVRAEFGSVRLQRSDESLGYVAQRNRAAQIASGALIFSLDDDAEFSTPLVVEQTLRDFDDPRIGAVAVPYLEPNKANQLLQSSPPANGVWITDAFVGTAHAVRRDLFLRLGGYREHFVHQGEEGDFCLRMLNTGYVVRLGNAEPIHHFDSPRRDFRRMDVFGRRNDILFAWHNVPFPWLAIHLAMTTLNGVIHGLEMRRPLRMLAGALIGYRDCWNYRHQRCPVSGPAYSLHRRLKRQGPLRLETVDSALSNLPRRAKLQEA